MELSATDGALGSQLVQLQLQELVKVNAYVAQLMVAATQPKEQATAAGYLEKMSPSSFKSWQKRWFELRGDKLSWWNTQAECKAGKPSRGNETFIAINLVNRQDGSSPMAGKRNGRQKDKKKRSSTEKSWEDAGSSAMPTMSASDGMVIEVQTAVRTLRLRCPDAEAQVQWHGALQRQEDSKSAARSAAGKTVKAQNSTLLEAAMAPGCGLALAKQGAWGKTASSLFPPDLQLIKLRSDLTLLEALGVLAEKRILAAPVYDGAGALTGFLDMMDIVAWLVTVLGETTAMGALSGGGGGSGSGQKSGMDMLRTQKFFSEPVSALLGLSSRNALVALPSSASIADCVATFAARACHRLCLVDAQGEISGVVTQSTILKFVKSNMQLVRPLCGKHVKNDLQLVQPPSVTILAHSSAFDSFGLLHEKQTRQLCIVDESGSITNKLSLQDLKGFDKRFMGHMADSVDVFLQWLMQEGYATKGRIANDLLNSTDAADCTFESAISKLVDNRVHRLYIVSGGGKKPSGQLSMIDLLRKVHEISSAGGERTL